MLVLALMSNLTVKKKISPRGAMTQVVLLSNVFKSIFQLVVKVVGQK